MAANQTRLDRILSGNFFFPFGSQDRDDTEKAVGLSRYIPSILFSQRRTAKLDNDARFDIKLFRSFGERDAVSHSGNDIRYAYPSVSNLFRCRERLLSSRRKPPKGFNFGKVAISGMNF